MQRKVLLTLALVFCLATAAQADLTVSVGNYTVPFSAGAATQQIPLFITGPATPITASNINVEIGPVGFTGGSFVFPNGPSPTLNFSGQNTVTPNSGTITGSVYSTAANGFGDAGTDNYNILVFQFLSVPTSPVLSTAGTGLLMNVIVNYGGVAPGTYPIIIDDANGNGPIDFQNNGNGVAATLINGSITITPEPSSVVLGLFAAASLGFVAIRKNRARRAA
jgi:hypothetical protein